jgi:MYXO-CTERM domain-containing protein
LFAIDEGQVLNVTTLPPNLTIRADTSPPTVGSVAFDLDGTFVRTENIGPYSFSSDDGAGDYRPWTLGLGSYSVTATPFSSASGSGTPGTPLTRSFTLSDMDGTGGSGEGGAAGAGTGGASSSSGGMSASGGTPSTDGTGGAGGVSTTDRPTERPTSDVEGSCACKTPGKAPAPNNAGWLGALAALGLLVRRRRQS